MARENGEDSKSKLVIQLQTESPFLLIISFIHICYRASFFTNCNLFISFIKRQFPEIANQCFKNDDIVPSGLVHICLFLITPCLLTRFVPLAKTVLQNERSSLVSKFYTSL